MMRTKTWPTTGVVLSPCVVFEWCRAGVGESGGEWTSGACRQRRRAGSRGKPPQARRPAPRAPADQVIDIIPLAGDGGCGGGMVGAGEDPLAGEG